MWRGYCTRTIEICDGHMNVIEIHPLVLYNLKVRHHNSIFISSYKFIGYNLSLFVDVRCILIGPIISSLRHII
jgi:hypothetical protein